MSYRPITDFWFLARAKLKEGHHYYGAYPGGFPERARALLGVTLTDPVLHVCGGMARHYPYQRGFGPNDKTMDIDPAVVPDWLQDARDPWPDHQWRGILIDPPYSKEDAGNYTAGAAAYPPPGKLLERAFEVLVPGGRVGILHYLLPKPPPGAIFVAAVAICCGFNNRIRVYSVFERPAEAKQ